MNKTKRKYVLDSIKESIAAYEFNLCVLNHAQTFFADKIGTILTKREGNKLFALIQQQYPNAGFYFKNESYGREFEFTDDTTSDYKRRNRQNVAIESLTTEKKYTQYIHDNRAESIAHRLEYLAAERAKLLHAHDIIDLDEKQELEREELAKRQKKEREIFEAQTKCPSSDLSFHYKQADERIKEEEKQAYYKKQQEEFEARNS